MLQTDASYFSSSNFNTNLELHQMLLWRYTQLKAVYYKAKKK